MRSSNVSVSATCRKPAAGTSPESIRKKKSYLEVLWGTRKVNTRKCCKLTAMFTLLYYGLYYYPTGSQIFAIYILLSGQNGRATALKSMLIGIPDVLIALSQAQTMDTKMADYPCPNIS
jgi:hypothetical protein